MLAAVAPALLRFCGENVAVGPTAARLLSSIGTSTSSSPADVLPVGIPEHEIEDGLPVITARVRHQAGSNFCFKLRKAGRTPGLLFSLPDGQQLLLDMCKREVSAHVRHFGRNGIQAIVMKLQLVSEEAAPLASVRVLPKRVAVNAVRQEPENLGFLYCPRERQVTVPIPVVLWNGELAPGVRKGGWLHQVNRAATLRCSGWAVRPRIELDARHMMARDVIRFSDLPIPDGCQLAVKDPSQPVVRCAIKAGGD